MDVEVYVDRSSHDESSDPTYLEDDLFMRMKERFLKTGRGRRPSLLDNFDSNDDELRLNMF